MARDTVSTARVQPFTVGEWHIDPRTCQASRGGTVERLRPQLVDLLVCLAKRPGQLVLKDEILAEVWPGQFIAESGLSRCIAELRQALADDAQQPRYIEATRKRGYRLIARVTWLDPAEPATRATSDPTPPAIAPEAAEWAGLRAPKVTVRRRVLAAVGLVLGAIGIVIAVMMTRSPANVLTAEDTVLLAFENRTGDAVFDAAVPLAMSIQLEQSPYLRLLSPGRVEEALRMMQRPPDTAVTRAIGLEICERVGGRALIVTSLASLGRQYAIGVEAVACPDRRVLGRRQVTTDTKEGVLAGLQRAAEEIRRVVGEPAATLRRYNVPISQATTRSLDALRALRRGDLARDGGEMGVALEAYREAVSLDRDFALAHARLGTVALPGGGTEAESVAALERAYALRERVTLPERLEIEGVYHYLITGEEDRVSEAFETLKKTYPRRAAFRRALAETHLRAGRFDAALAEAREAARLEPNSVINLIAVGRAYLYSNRIAAARASAERGIALGGTHPFLHFILFHCALATGDEQALARERAWAAVHPDAATAYIGEAEAEESMSRGRLQEALGFLKQIETQAAAGGLPQTAAVMRLRMARYEALCGLDSQALGRVAEEARRGLTPTLRIDAVKVAVSAGDFTLAARLLDEAEREPSAGSGQPNATFVRAYRAAIETANGRAERALALLTPLEPVDLGIAYGFIPLFERARAYARAGNWSMARAAFEKILAHPTIDSGRKLIPLAQIGLARALARAGDTAASRRAYEQFFERWKTADAGLPLLARARTEYQALK